MKVKMLKDVGNGAGGMRFAKDQVILMSTTSAEKYIANGLAEPFVEPEEPQAAEA
jgi:hypothetical protein